MSSLALMYHLAIWLFLLRVLSKFGRPAQRGRPLHYRARNCNSLVANATKNRVLASNWLPQRKTTLLVDERYDLFEEI